MKVLVTGANGFVGQNLIATLRLHPEIEIYTYDLDNTAEDLHAFTQDCEFVFHLAGVNRPENPEEFMTGNFGFTTQLLEALQIHGNKAPILITSSIQAELENDYGKSKRAGEQVVFDYATQVGTQAYVYRLPNVFGKWCRPNYNSAIATFCYNIANGLSIQVNNRDHVMNLVYIDDVVAAFIAAMNGQAIMAEQFTSVPEVSTLTLGEIADLIASFPTSRQNLQTPFVGVGVEKQLYSTYLSYLPHDQFAYDLKMNVDNRGSFTEFLKTPERGQVSINVSKPGITKGNHWHHTKTEKFLVVSGEALIQFRQINSQEIIEYRVNGDQLRVVDIPTGYTHNIINVGTTDLVTVMWANEAFDPQRPDTFFLEV